MDDLELLVDLHIEGDRQGPGSEAATLRSVELSGLGSREGLAVADIGCGTGASTLVLARSLDARITAIDLVPPFLNRLEEAARRHGIGDRITTAVASMEQLEIDEGSLDAIWSEGAIYNIGFERGVRSWRRFLKPDGILALSELTWLTRERPAELEVHWAQVYPEVGTASSKFAVLERCGFSPIGYFPLPESCWLDNYYEPMQERFCAFLERHGDSPAARQVVRAEQAEIELFERFSQFFGYGYYLAKRSPG